jgi:hypothetical protein
MSVRRLPKGESGECQEASTRVDETEVSMGQSKIVRRIAFRAAGIGSALALAGLVLVASPAAAVSKTTTTTVTFSVPAETGAPITFTATVVHNLLTPTGTVTFSITGADSSTATCDGGNDTIPLAPATTGSSAQCSISAGLFAHASPYSVTATYSGDPTFAGSTGMLSKIIHLGPTNTVVTPSSNPTHTGQPVSFMAAVAPVSPSTGSPTGTVTFAITGTDGSTPSCDTSNTQPLSGGVATCSLSSGLLASGNPFTVAAKYSGDPDFATSTGSATEDVARAVATVSVTSSANGLPVVNGQSVSFTGTVSPPAGAGTPTGSLVFNVTASTGQAETCDGGNTVALTGLSAVCNFAGGLSARPLSYTVTATLQDPNFKSPVAGSLVQQVNRASTTTELQGLPGSLVASQAFTFDVKALTVAPGTGSPTGEIEWAVCLNPATSCTPQNGTKGGTLDLPTPTTQQLAISTNKATISVPGGLSPGFYDVFASFPGNVYLTSSTAPVGHIEVTEVPTTLTLTLTHNPVANGGRVVIRAAVNANARATSALGAPTGTVTFTITGMASDTLMCDGGSNVITISTTTGNQGLAGCVIDAGQLMSTDSPYQLQAVYSGDSNFAGSTTTGSLSVEAP